MVVYMQREGLPDDFTERNFEMAVKYYYYTKLLLLLLLCYYYYYYYYYYHCVYSITVTIITRPGSVTQSWFVLSAESAGNFG